MSGPEKRSTTVAWMAGGIAVTCTVVALGTLVVLLGREGKRAHTVLEAAVEQAKAGLHPCAGFAEGERVEAALRDTVRVRLQNFLVQAETACYSVTLEGPHTVDGAFLYRVAGERRELLAASLEKSCACPDADLGPCTLR
ncbi:MAG: hypothetical protein R3F61_13590 [Myxococcota bacterium]